MGHRVILNVGCKSRLSCQMQRKLAAQIPGGQTSVVEMIVNTTVKHYATVMVTVAKIVMITVANWEK